MMTRRFDRKRYLLVKETDWPLADLFSAGAKVIKARNRKLVVIEREQAETLMTFMALKGNKPKNIKLTKFDPKVSNRNIKVIETPEEHPYIPSMASSWHVNWKIPRGFFYDDDIRNYRRRPKKRKVPAIKFRSDPDAGIYFSGKNQINYTTVPQSYGRGIR